MEEILNLLGQIHQIADPHGLYDEVLASALQNLLDEDVKSINKALQMALCEWDLCE